MNNLYNRTYLDNKFSNIYDKTEINNNKSKLNRNINLFNGNLTSFVDKYKEGKKIDEDIKDNKNKLNNFIINSFSTFSNNVNNINNNNKSRLTELEKYKLNDDQLTKINSSYNFSVFNKTKLDKMSYYIKEIFMHNIDLVRKFNINGEQDCIQILQFEIDRQFLINYIIKFFLSIKIVYLNMKTNYWTLFLRLDAHYKNEVLIKRFNKYMLSKGFLFKNLAHFDTNDMFKLNQNTDRLIFKLYMEKVNKSYKNDITIILTNEFESSYCNIDHLRII